MNDMHTRNDQHQDGMPDCPDWCTLGAGHAWDIPMTDGGRAGFHEGILTAVPDDDGGRVTLTMAQAVRRHSDGSVTTRPAYVTMTTAAGGTEYTSAHTLRDLGDALRKTAGRIEQG